LQELTTLTIQTFTVKLNGGIKFSVTWFREGKLKNIILSWILKSSVSQWLGIFSTKMERGSQCWTMLFSGSVLSDHLVRT